ncbi:hypothetical protein B0T19DRAFT_437483 [Cercophora scortea]|uniref:Uncharacterized protein n=1 Tax=Cercophora scortea TaxID=314031 RepID=A0AAE0J568_9PEZI|nr:hypothetical protein B0T19DRAFT_437483 [Cercophora scortea]
MSSPSADEIRRLSEQAQPFAPAGTHLRRPSTFLSLAPKTSESYPRTQQQQAKPKEPIALTADALAAATKQDEASAALAKQRTSSLSSNGSKQFRYLKLGPVHWGEHQDSHQGDWHEVVID